MRFVLVSPTPRSSVVMLRCSRNPRSAASVPPEGALDWSAAFPSRGSSREESPALYGSIGRLRSLTRHSAALVAFARRYFASGPVRSRRPDLAPRGLGGFSRGARAARQQQGRDEPSQVLGRPLRTCPDLRPRRSVRTRPLRHRHCCLPPFRTRRLRKDTFEARSHGPHAICGRFAGGVAPTPRNTRLRRMANPYRLGICARRVTIRGFKLLHFRHRYPSLFQTLPNSTQ